MQLGYTFAIMNKRVPFCLKSEFFTFLFLGERTYFLFVEVHFQDEFLIEHFIFFLGDLIVDFI